MVLPTEISRQVRIVILKVTHLPFVAIILVLEASWLYWNDRRSARSISARAVRGPGTSKSLRHPFSGRLMQHPVLAAGTRPTQLVESTQQPRTAGTPGERQLQEEPAAVPETVDMLVNEMADLKTKVETLTSLLERQLSRPTTASS